MTLPRLLGSSSGILTWLVLSLILTLLGAAAFGVTLWCFFDLTLTTKARERPGWKIALGVSLLPILWFVGTASAVAYIFHRKRQPAGDAPLESPSEVSPLAFALAWTFSGLAFSALSILCWPANGNDVGGVFLADWICVGVVVSISVLWSRPWRKPGLVRSLLLLVSVVTGWFGGIVARATLLSNCTHGSGPDPRWCLDDRMGRTAWVIPAFAATVLVVTVILPLLSRRNRSRAVIETPAENGV